MTAPATSRPALTVHPRRVVAWVVLAALLGLATLVSSPTGPGDWLTALLVAGIGAGTLAQYVPTAGHRLDLGCTPCAVAAGFSVPVAVALLATSGGLAVLVATAGLVQRLRQPAACPT